MDSQAVPLYVSIPPEIRRYDASGEFIGDEYLGRCIDSWRAHGFEPISLNSCNEKINALANSKNVKFLLMNRDAAELCGKPLVYIKDFVDHMKGYPGVVALTNADILFNIDALDFMKIKGIEPGEVAVLKRLDVSGLKCENPIAYRGGYDFLAFHPQDLKGFDSDSFVFGQPWWDYYILLYFMANGVKSMRLNNSVITHLVHSERWDEQSFNVFCDYFIDELKSISASKSACIKNSHVDDLMSALDGREPSLIKRIRFLVRSASEGGRRKNKFKQNLKMAAITNRHLDEYFGF